MFVKIFRCIWLYAFWFIRCNALRQSLSLNNTNTSNAHISVDILYIVTQGFPLNWLTAWLPLWYLVYNLVLSQRFCRGSKWTNYVSVSHIIKQNPMIVRLGVLYMYRFWMILNITLVCQWTRDRQGGFVNIYNRLMTPDLGKEMKIVVEKHIAIATY